MQAPVTTAAPSLVSIANPARFLRLTQIVLKPLTAITLLLLAYGLYLAFAVAPFITSRAAR